MLEFERLFLAKRLPEGLEKCRFKEVLDIYLPHDSHHPVLRIRKNGDKYEMTKKEVVSIGVFSEQTIVLSPDEFDSLSKIQGKLLHKTRYFYPHENRTLEIGVFQGALKGLVLIDVEFASEENMKNFIMPDFFLAEVKNKEFLAGGMLCGKSYADIEPFLSQMGYRKI
ncbi:MAG TPA: hypothetical protein VI612_03780 [Candidatus Nanoarchaeia archaeon]|nr:hypothetical protein [Candidatus Nanoarchaeia archaeon]